MPVVMGREKQYYVDNIAALIRRNFKGLTQNSDDKSVKDIASLAEQERAKKYCNFISLIIDAIKMSVTRQKQEGKDKEKLMLNAELVNKCLSDVIERDILYIAQLYQRWKAGMECGERL